MTTSERIVKLTEDDLHEESLRIQIRNATEDSLEAARRAQQLNKELNLFRTKRRLAGRTALSNSTKGETK